MGQLPSSRLAERFHLLSFKNFRRSSVFFLSEVEIDSLTRATYGAHSSGTRQTLDDHVDVQRAHYGCDCASCRSVPAAGFQELWTMKKSLFPAVLALLLIGSMAAAAQAPGGQWGPGGQPPTADQRLQRMAQALQLTGDQQEKIKPILESEASQMQELRANTSLSQEDRMAKMKEIRANTTSQINPILTPDQQTKYAEMMSRMGRGRPAGPNTSTPPQPQ